MKRPTPILVMTFLPALAGCTSGPRERTSEASPPLEAYARLTERWFDGWTKVREFDSRPARLNLSDDLGLETGTAVTVGLAGDDIHRQWAVEAELFGPNGHGRFDRDFQYDEGNFQGGLPLDTSSRFLFLRGHWAPKDWGWQTKNLWIAPSFGFEYPNFSLGIDQPGVDDTSEGYHQFMPYPTVGFALGWQLSKQTAIEASGATFWATRIPTIYHEGGRHYMSIRTFSFDAAFKVRLSERVAAMLGADFQYFNVRLRSHEDSNELFYRSPAIFAGLRVAF